MNDLVDDSDGDSDDSCKHACDDDSADKCTGSSDSETNVIVTKKTRLLKYRNIYYVLQYIIVLFLFNYIIFYFISSFNHYSTGVPMAVPLQKKLVTKKDSIMDKMSSAVSKYVY